MIMVDGRDGSKELAALIENSVIVELEYGDVAMVGNGPEGWVNVGIERKRITDLINSIATGRLAGHQIPGLISNYDVTYLIVEGLWRSNPYDDGLEIWKKGGWRSYEHGRKWRCGDIWKFLTTAEQTGVRVRCAGSMRETCNVIGYLYDWWAKPWTKHHGHEAMHITNVSGTASLTASKPSLKRVIAAQLPKVGTDRSKMVEAHFKSIREMMNASEEEWTKIEGIGKVTARLISEAINKEE